MLHKQTPQQEEDSDFDFDFDNEDNDSLPALMQAQHTKQAMKAVEPDDDETVEQELMQANEPQPLGGTSALAGGSPALAGASGGQHIDAGDNDDDQDMSYGTDPVLEAMFAKAGGLGRDPRAGHADDADEEQAPGPGQGRTAAAEPEGKLGWGSRICSGLKGIGQLALSPGSPSGGSWATACTPYPCARCRRTCGTPSGLHQPRLPRPGSAMPTLDSSRTCTRTWVGHGWALAALAEHGRNATCSTTSPGYSPGER